MTGRLAVSRRRQFVWYLVGRLLTFALFFISAIVYEAQTLDHRALHGLQALAILLFAQSLVGFALLRWVQDLGRYLQAQTVWDLLLVTVFVCLTGGTGSPYPFIYILVILSAAAFFSRRQTLIVAAASAILFGSLIDLQYFGYLVDIPGIPQLDRPVARDALYALYTNVLAFFLSAFLGGLLAARLRRSEAELQQREIDYAELDRLNRIIVANIGSGLMTVNSAGRIRLFNLGAERITGLTLATVYDQDVREFFPGLELFDGSGRLQQRAEGYFVDADGRKLLLGYASVGIPLGDSETGLLVSFQDLTRLREIEEELRRSDRLAAVGRLAAGMAHEIRNPLASISGSVQLLIEGGTMRAEDERLMRIVVREADRLSLLLGDFLQFARPSTPQISECDLSALMRELREQLAGDPRFAHVEIELFSAQYAIFSCDAGQIRQALINLMINAAEAMQGQGRLRVEIDPAIALIRVEDSGPGIPARQRDAIFTPFHTTRDNGTGLGLATVHAIVTAHNGTISVADSPLGGARFTVTLPPVMNRNDSYQRLQ